MAKKSEPDLISLAFQLVTERGWRHFSFTELAPGVFAFTAEGEVRVW